MSKKNEQEQKKEGPSMQEVLQMVQNKCSEFAEHMQKSGVMIHVIAMPAFGYTAGRQPIFIESWDENLVYELTGLLEYAKTQINLDIVAAKQAQTPQEPEQHPQPVNEPSEDELQAEMDAQAAASQSAAEAAAEAEAMAVMELE